MSQVRLYQFEITLCFVCHQATYVNWAQNEPNDDLGREDCVVLQQESAILGLWNDVPCDAPKGFICKKPTGKY